MHEYQVEIIHEPSGKYMNFTLFTEDTDYDEMSREILAEMSIVIYKGELVHE